MLLIDDLAFDTPKTSKLLSYLDGIGAEGKALILTNGEQAQRLSLGTQRRRGRGSQLR